ncbi:hypothetical protein ACQJBY_001881 [Aegilops geniculata]
MLGQNIQPGTTQCRSSLSNLGFRVSIDFVSNLSLEVRCSCCLFRLLRLHSACCLLPCQEVARFLLGELFLSFLSSRVNICRLVVMCGGSFLDVLDALNEWWMPGRKGMPCQEVAGIFFCLHMDGCWPCSLLWIDMAD